MFHQIIQHNKSCLNKYSCRENQMQEDETMKDEDETITY